MVLYILKLNQLYFLQCFIIVRLNVNRVGTHNITGLLEHLSVNLEVDSQTLRPLVHIVLVNPLPRSGGGGIIGMLFVRYIFGQLYNFVQMLSSLRRCTVTLTQFHTSKVKVTQDV